MWIVNHLPLKFPDDHTVEAIAAKLTNLPFNDWVDSIPESIASPVKVSAAIGIVDDVGVIKKISIT